jgi:hypothetical protein
MIRLGTSLKSNEYPFHRCLVLSDPSKTNGQVVLVRITTDDGSWPDRDCFLTPQDWAELDHSSTAAYSTCKFGSAVEALELAIKNRLFVEISAPPANVLKRIIAAARLAPGMPPGAKRWLADESQLV